ncbi:MAG: LysR family transcriptional regulator [Rhodoglobus sp.]|nr:LysR family transcriptional regulator [Rhodoglobus sp.]
MPASPLTLRALSQGAALAALADGTVDAALLRLPIEDESISTIALYAEQPVVVAAKGHALEAVDNVTLAELAGFGILEDSDWEAAVELAAANVGVAVMPQSVARAHSRRDVTARPVTDAPETRIALAWPTARTTGTVDEFIGIVRGRTANSSRGVRPPEPEKKPEPAKKAAPKGGPKKPGPRKPGPRKPPKRPKRR